MFYALRRLDNDFEYAAWIDENFCRNVLPWFALLVAAAMVSRIPYPHVVNQILSGHRQLCHLVGIIFAFVA